MKISILKENTSLEQRVAATPDTIKLLIKLGGDVFIEHGAGILSGYEDDVYVSAGAQIASRQEWLNSEIVLCVSVCSEMSPNIPD